MSADETSVESEPEMTLEECQTTLAAVRQESEELHDKYLRAAAEIENTRKQAEREATRQLNQRLSRLYLRLLEVADNLERALAQPAETAALHTGVEATWRQLQSVLRQEGVTRIDVEVGARFDPQLHEAISVQEDEVDQAVVAEVLQSGYMFDGQLLRPARVTVTAPARART